MAQRTLTLTFPDGQGPRIAAALKVHFGRIEDPVGSGVYRDRTNAEAWQEFEVRVRASLRDIVTRVDREAARAAAEAGVTAPDVT